MCSALRRASSRYILLRRQATAPEGEIPGRESPPSRFLSRPRHARQDFARDNRPLQTQRACNLLFRIQNQSAEP